MQCFAFPSAVCLQNIRVSLFAYIHMQQCLFEIVGILFIIKLWRGTRMSNIIVFPLPMLFTFTLDVSNLSILYFKFRCSRQYFRSKRTPSILLVPVSYLPVFYYKLQLQFILLFIVAESLMCIVVSQIFHFTIRYKHWSGVCECRLHTYVGKIYILSLM